MTQNQERLFSLDEIQRLLPDLEVRIARFQEKKAAYNRMHDHLLMEELLQDIESRQGQTEAAGSDEEAGKLEIAVAELEREIREMRRLGCLLQDLEKGWVDFPALYKSEKVFLSWKCGEPAVRYYRVNLSKAAERRLL